MSTRLVAVAVLLAVATQASALGKGKAVYMGGTVTSIADKTEGRIDVKNEERLIFVPKAGATLEIPWATVADVEYGQKAGRRVVMAVVLSPLALFSKNRKHYVTFTWKDGEDKEQAAVLQFDKEDIRPALSIIRVRTGKEITFQDEDAQKQMGGKEKK
jgi:hypothetical protein